MLHSLNNRIKFNILINFGSISGHFPKIQLIIDGLSVFVFYCNGPSQGGSKICFRGLWDVFFFHSYFLFPLFYFLLTFFFVLFDLHCYLRYDPPVVRMLKVKHQMGKELRVDLSHFFLTFLILTSKSNLNYTN